MAKQICKTAIRKGVGIIVKNTEAVFGAADKYVNFYLDFADGAPGRCVMFTPKEVAGLFSRPEIISGWEPDRGELYSGFIGGHHCWIVNLEFGGIKKVVRLSTGLLNTAIARANKNPEDVTNPSWLMKIFG